MATLFGLLDALSGAEAAPCGGGCDGAGGKGDAQLGIELVLLGSTGRSSRDTLRSPGPRAPTRS
jgi:hypothetical protein